MIKLYFDLHVHGVVFQNLIANGVDVIRGQDDGMDGVPDEKLLERASELKRVLVTSDKDFFEIAANFQSNQKYFSGVLFYRATKVGIKDLIDDLTLISSAGKLIDFENLLICLPL
ncbi:DUF5615 family PIN-like protein [Candidatus Uabimicrobium amorphum]|uniref:DUF5615 domain-containing protein n=1 Tax=Uabimicrobium amorphum TaxID=2596890 RepID=A0A5S9F5Z9_UABAM|nr:DUF5615 family PIN-like protein [Candidatus Uabimicrobium amorphum]BBM86851.1 hypothetical protein UABAM_05248 [Candidatus Uabimicrobium amorphum]